MWTLVLWALLAGARADRPFDHDAASLAMVAGDRVWAVEAFEGPEMVGVVESSGRVMGGFSFQVVRRFDNSRYPRFNHR